MFTISSSRRSSSNLPIASNCPSLSPKLFYQSLLLASCFILEVTVTGTSCLAPDSLIASTCCSLHAPVFRVRASWIPFPMCLSCSSFLLADRCLCAHSACVDCTFLLVFLFFFFVLAMFRYYVDFVYFFGYIYQLQQRLTSDLVFCVLYLGPLYATACTYADFKTSNLMYVKYKFPPF